MRITVAGLGADGQADEKLLSAARTASRVVLQAEVPNNLRENAINYETLDSFREQDENSGSFSGAAEKALLSDGTVFIVPGDACFDATAAKLVRSALEKGAQVSVISGGDRALCAAFRCGYADGTGGVRICTAASFERACETDGTLVINGVDTRRAACGLKQKLLKYYGAMHEVFFADIRDNNGKIIPLFLLDSMEAYGYYTSIVLRPVPLEKKARFGFCDLVAIMDRLRGENGCPWDNEQTHESLKRYLLEESYEVIEAIDEGDTKALYDELGDVLLQVVFHSRIAEQRGEFDISDVTTAICSKMISRHTHIFGDVCADTSQQVLKNWEQIKKAEKGQDSQSAVLFGVPKSMPALLRSEKVQSKAAGAGMDFPGFADAVSKLYEEIGELKDALSGSGNVSEECGDLLFAAVNLVRLAGAEPETALQRATDKFIARFSAAEKAAAEQGIDMRSCDPEKLDELWDNAKKR